MKEALIVATVASHLSNFCRNDILILKELGSTITVAANFNTENNIDKESIEDYKNWLMQNEIQYYNICFTRAPLDIKNYKAYKQLRKIIQEKEYEIIHCHTPVAGLLTRICANYQRKHGTKIIYTAHGFHFYNGAPLKHWLLYYPIEKFISYFTDIIITINKEDYLLAKKKMKAGSIIYIPGVGIDVDRYARCNINRNKKRKEIGVPEGCILILSVGELNINKNHEAVIRAIAKLNNYNIHYAIAGIGELKNYLYNLGQKLGVDDRLHFLGFRKDAHELYKTADIFAFPSKREGLGLAAIEAMAAGLPIIAMDIRGPRDYIISGKGNFLINSKNNETIDIAQAILQLSERPKLRLYAKAFNYKTAKKFNIEETAQIMKSVYKSLLL